MDVIRALGATLWKMFAGDLFLTIGAVASVLVLGLLLRAGVLPPAAAPYVLAAAVVGVFISAVNLSLLKELKKAK